MNPNNDELYHADRLSWREEFIDTSVIFGAIVVAITEILSWFHALTTAGVIAAWILVAVAIGGWIVRKGTPAIISRAGIPAMTREERACVGFMALICLVTLFVALAGLPLAMDSLAYHLPRILYWIRNRTVAFYPTHELRQLVIGPGWEYFAVQLQLLAGTERLSSIIQWSALVANPVVVSLLARELGAERRGQLLAALFTLSIPMAIAEGSGSQVDLFSAYWLATSLALMLRVRRQGLENTTLKTVLLLGVSIGIGILSKATIALFLMPFIVWIGASVIKGASPARFISRAILATVLALAVNAPHMARNRAVVGSMLGVERDWGLGNETFRPKSIASNVIRNASLHLGTPSNKLNAILTLGISRLHAGAGVDVNDRRTTYQGTVFAVASERDNEGQASNQLHFLLIVGVSIALTAKVRRSPVNLYMLCAVAAALLFCIYLKWQPWHSRLQLPLFVISGATVGAGLERILRPDRLRWVAIALAFTALNPTFRNSMRPLAARHPIFTLPYERKLLHDERRFESYTATADFIASNGCSRIGLMQLSAFPEFQVWKLMQRRQRSWPEIRPVAVANESRRTATDTDRKFKPCAIIMVDPNSVATGAQRNDVPPGFVRKWHDRYFTIFLAPRS